jgi:hypothetical protein
MPARQPGSGAFVTAVPQGTAVPWWLGPARFGTVTGGCSCCGLSRERHASWYAQGVVYRNKGLIKGNVFGRGSLSYCVHVRST